LQGLFGIFEQTLDNFGFAIALADLLLDGPKIRQLKT
jgi:hypothetical protein